jgi:RNA polymerase sigma-70 factor, ECF subfamily
MLGNDTDALDATQDALLGAVRGIARFDGRSAFGTWLYRIATNACLDELRRRRRRPIVARGRDLSEFADTAERSGRHHRPDEELWTTAVASSTFTSSTRASAAAATTTVPSVPTTGVPRVPVTAPDVSERVVERIDADRALGALPFEFRSAVVLRDLCDLPYDEIADILSVPIGTVRSRIARGRAALADLLGDPGGPGLGNPVSDRFVKPGGPSQQEHSR